MTMRAYPRYKDSGVEWLGAMPEHWSSSSLKHVVANIQSGGTPESGNDKYWAIPDDPDAIYWVAIADMTRSSMVTETDRQITEAGRASKGLEVLPVGTLLYSMYASLGKVSTLGIPAVVNQAILGIVPNASVCVQPFLTYWLQNMEPCLSLFSSSNTQDNLNAAKVRSFPVLVPTLPEQAAIAAFLDRETAKIDALVAEQRRLIELLTEKRRAVISHAVTKGLNPDAPMKHSGIDWLGEVPEHWEVASLRFRYSVQLGKMLDTSRISGNSLRPYLRVADVQWGRINLDDLPEMDFDDDIRDRFRLHIGDLLVNEGGSYPGRCAIWNGELPECYFQKALHRLRPIKCGTDDPRFMYYLMAWATSHGVFAAGGNESTIEHLPAEKFRKYRFPFPSFAEQCDIASHLDVQLQRLDEMIDSINEAIRVLQERRTALISAAVTGKIDVRGLAPADSPPAPPAPPASTPAVHAGPRTAASVQAEAASR